MKEHVFRLHENDDLKLSIIKYCDNHKIDSALILTAVGCVKKLHLRKAKAKAEFLDENDYEIVSLVGTISKDGVHLHGSFSDENLKTLGGHLLENTIINTTCEIVLGELEEYKLSRRFDQKTGYKELGINKKPV